MSIRRVDSNRSRERLQWAQLDRYRQDVRIVGRGEAILDDVYFGRGFSRPPTFTYSAVFNKQATPVKPWFVVPPRGVMDVAQDQYGMGPDSLGPSGMIQDPSFELQGKYRNLSTSSGWDVIPDVYERTYAIYDYYYGSGTFNDAMFPIAYHMTYNSYTNDWGPKYQNGANDFFDGHRWLQTADTHDRWSVTNADRHDLGVGNVGTVCATAAIGQGGYTNWLLPFDWSWPFDGSNITPANAWRSWRSVTEALGTTNSAAFGGGPWMQAFPPPYIEGFDGFAYVKTSGNAELQVNATLHMSDWDYTGNRGTKVFPDSDFDWGGASDNYSYRELASVDFSQNMTGSSEWQKVEIDLPYSGWRSWPDVPTCLDARGEPKTPLYWNFRFRVKGTPGQSVYLDNVFLTRTMRNSEIPMLTIGVAEWIRDAAGVYIGARLWVTMGEPSRGPCS